MWQTLDREFGSSARLQISIRSNERLAFFISAIARSGMGLSREERFLICLLVGKLFSPHREVFPRQFGVWNYRLTWAGENRSPFIIISLYKHKASFLSTKEICICMSSL